MRTMKRAAAIPAILLAVLLLMPGAELTVESVMLERELVESEGFTYLRIPCTDHTCPMPDRIDAFIDFVKSVDPENTWFHFHCVGGKGRTGTFMMLYDKMRNPQVSDMDIMYRHAKMGASYPIYTGTGSNAPMYAEKAELTPLLYRYVEENAAAGYPISWNDWLTEILDVPQGLEVHFLDVGQGDSELLLCDGHAMLIDGGTTAAGIQQTTPCWRRPPQPMLSFPAA